VRWGQEGGYFADNASRDAFKDELSHLLVEQKMAFNSPVWFNVGVQKPQCSAVLQVIRQDSRNPSWGLRERKEWLFKVGLGHGERIFGACAAAKRH